MEVLTAICEPLMKYLEENHDPHTEIVISSDGIKLMSAEIWIPRTKK